MTVFNFYIKTRDNLSDAFAGGMQTGFAVASDDVIVPNVEPVFSMNLNDSNEREMEINPVGFIKALQDSPLLESQPASFSSLGFDLDDPVSGQTLALIENPDFQTEVRAIKMNSQFLKAVIDSPDMIIASLDESKTAFPLEKLAALIRYHSERVENYAAFCDSARIQTSEDKVVNEITQAFRGFRNKVHDFNLEQYQSAVRFELGGNSPSVIKSMFDMLRSDAETLNTPRSMLDSTINIIPKAPSRIRVMDQPFNNARAYSNISTVLTRLHGGAMESEALFPYQKALSSMNLESQKKATIDLYNAFDGESKEGFVAFVGEQPNDEIKAAVVNSIVESKSGHDEYLNYLSKSIRSNTEQPINLNDLVIDSCDRIRHANDEYMSNVHAAKLAQALEVNIAPGNLSHSSMDLINNTLSISDYPSLNDKYQQLLALPEFIDHLMDMDLPKPVVRKSDVNGFLEINYQQGSSDNYSALANPEIPAEIALLQYPNRSQAEKNLLKNPAISHLHPRLLAEVKKEFKAVAAGELPEYAMEHPFGVRAFFGSENAEPIDIQQSMHSKLGFMDSDMPNLVTSSLFNDRSPHLDNIRKEVVPMVVQKEIQDHGRISEYSMLTALEQEKSIDRMTPEAAGNILGVTLECLRQESLNGNGDDYIAVLDAVEEFKTNLGNSLAAEKIKISLDAAIASPYNGKVNIDMVAENHQEQSHVRGGM